MSILEPTPTKQDMRVLRAVPASNAELGEHQSTARTVSQVVGAMRAPSWRKVDLDDIERTLRGFEHLGYLASVESRDLKSRVWWRTPKGDEAVAGASTREQAA